MKIIDRIKNKEIKCAVIGLGYVGLPLLCEIVKAGYEAVGIDVSEEKVDSINKGVSYIQDVPTKELASLVKTGKLIATTDYAVLAECDAISVCVPTPLRKSKEPDISYIVSASDEVAKYLRKGQLIILESTTYPGTTEELVLPILNGEFHEHEHEEIFTSTCTHATKKVVNGNEGAIDASCAVCTEESLKIGEDFFLAFSPERVDPGNPDFKTRDIAKVIGGITPACSQAAAAYYGELFPKMVPVSTARAAEMVKLLENTFRSVNIALANEMSLMSDVLDVDIWEVINAAATKPFGFMPFYPGPGLGGHCIPIDPLYLTWKARLKGFEAKFIELASEVNQKMPAHIVRKVQDLLNEKGRSLRGSNVVIVGVAYKEDVSDTRESPALEIIKILRQKGAEVFYHDPYVASIGKNGLRMQSIELSDAAIKGADCVVITTAHKCVNYDVIKNNNKAIIDTRNILKSVTSNS